LCCLTSNDCHISLEGDMKHLWVFKFSDCYIVFAIVVQFHYVDLKVESKHIIIVILSSNILFLYIFNVT
jgi:hypothetical protein